jgi:predicted nucleotide-binding protein
VGLQPPQQQGGFQPPKQQGGFQPPQQQGGFQPPKQHGGFQPPQQQANNHVDKNTNKKNKVFIVHGHDDLAKEQIARFVTQVGLVPIILHEQASSSKTIIEKIEKYAEEVCFAVVLYTPCDQGSKNGDSTQLPRARQNVVFEHGYFIGKLGRENVTAVVKGSLEKPNDISGVVYEIFDENGAWKLKLAKEMKNSGCKIDMNNII